MPSASFGSNQVDFGGMIAPASATAIRSAHLRRIEREGGRAPAGADAPFEFAEPAPAADEVDALVGARIGDAEERLDDMAGEEGDRQPADRIIGRDQAGASRSRYQRPPRTIPNSPADAGSTGASEGSTVNVSRSAASNPSASRPLRS